MTQKQVSVLKHLIKDFRGAGRRRMVLVLSRDIDAIEALLAEREELLKDKVRLDWLEARSCGFDHVTWGEYRYYSSPKPEHKLEPARAAIDAAMKGERDE